MFASPSRSLVEGMSASINRAVVSEKCPIIQRSILVFSLDFIQFFLIITTISHIHFHSQGFAEGATYPCIDVVCEAFVDKLILILLIGIYIINKGNRYFLNLLRFAPY